MSFFDEIVGKERAPFRQAPEGIYLVTVKSARRVKANSGNEGIDIAFVLNENLDGADLEGVELGRCQMSTTFWTDAKSEQFTRDRLRYINPETAGLTGAEALEVLPGSQVVVQIAHETHNRKTGEPLNTPRLKPIKFWSTDYYFNKKVA